MAQYMQDGGQQGGPFAYVPEWPATSSYTNYFPENIHQQSILDPNDSALIAGFFQNPDEPTLSENFSWLDPHTNMKVDGTGFESQLSGLDTGSQTVSNPAVTLSGPQQVNYQTHSDSQMQQRMPIPTQHTHLSDSNTNQPSEAELAASQLYNMHMVSQDQSSLHFNNLAAGSWGNIDVGHSVMDSQEAVKSPLTSSGRQSSNSYHSQSQNLSFNQQQFPNLMGRQQQLPHMWQTQQQMQSTPRAYQQPLQVDTSATYSFFQNPQMQAPQSAQARVQTYQRPTMVQFGSDSSFGSGGYHPPNGYMTQEDEKAANLNNVPFAAQVAARGQSHAQALTPEALQRLHQRHSVPNSATNFHGPLSTSSNLGGLPLPFTSPTSAAHRHSHPFHQMARHSIEDSKLGDNDAEFDESQPRKRRKSQLQRDDDDEEYTPYGHVKSANPKRGPKPTKIGPESEDEDDDYVITPSTTKASAKRRKSTTKARVSPDSDEWTSMHSDNDEPSSSGKKKSRNSQASRLNLTEEEKRMNHIRSEKTRRDLIKIQYDTLDDLVPALKSGKSGLSRADILQEIVNYVENTAAGNKTIREMIPSMFTNGAGSSNGGVD